MPKHPHPADHIYPGAAQAQHEAGYASQATGRTQDGVVTTLDLTVAISCPHPGACPRVRAYGHGAAALRDAVLEIVGRNFGSQAPGMGPFARAEIEAIFEGIATEGKIEIDRVAMRAALYEVSQGLARALAQVPE